MCSTYHIHRPLAHDVAVAGCRDCAGSPCNVPRKQVIWLGLKAFQQMMTQKQAMYSEALQVMANRLRDPAFLRVPGSCHEAVIMAQSADFLQILF